MIIKYVEVETSAMGPGSLFKVKFAVEYFSDYSAVLRSAAIGFAFMFIFVIFVVIIRFWAFTNRNPRSQIGENGNKAWTFRILLYIFDYWSNFMFLLIYLICFGIFVNYKLSMSATMLLPEEGEASTRVRRPFFAVFGMVVVFKLTAVCMKIYDQARIDIFIID